MLDETELAGAGAAFDADPGYLNTATVGVPPRAAAAAVAAQLEAWRRGRLDPASFDEDVAASRASFARLVGVTEDWVASGPAVSVYAGLVAAALPAGTRVLAAEEEFTSVLFPFLAQMRRHVEVRLVPLERLVESITPGVDLVAVSLVQSSDGRRLDAGELRDAARRCGARTFVDLTQAAGWLPIDASGFDFAVCGAYKWLLSPRGTAFFVIPPHHRDELVPHLAGWYAGSDIWTSIYGPPLRLATDARRFDVSPAWLCWTGTRVALSVVEAIGVERIWSHDLALARRFCDALELPEPDGAIVSVAAADAAERLGRAGLSASVRAGRARLSFHLHNRVADVDAAVSALREPSRRDY